MRRFLPFIEPRRSEALVFSAQEVRIEKAVAFVEERNRDRPPDRQMTLFHLLLRGLSRSFHDTPALNRFVAGGRLWQRNKVSLSYSLKKSLDGHAPMLTVKRDFPADETLDETVDGILNSLLVGNVAGDHGLR